MQRNTCLKTNVGLRQAVCQRALLNLIGRLHQFRGTVPLSDRVKKLRANDPLPINQEGTRMRNAVLPRPHTRVAYPVSIDRLTADVGQKRIRDFVLVGKILQHVDRIVTDGNDLHSSAGGFLQVLLQLYQLPFAKWSPVGGSIKNDSYLSFLK